MKSAARARLARMIAEKGVNGALLVFTDSPEGFDEADEGPGLPPEPGTGVSDDGTREEAS